MNALYRKLGLTLNVSSQIFLDWKERKNIGFSLVENLAQPTKKQV